MATAFAHCISLLLPFLLLPLSHALDLSGKIQWNDICPAYSHILGAKAVLDNRRWSGNVRVDGHFVIPNIPPGIFVLSILSHDFHFDQLRIDVPVTNATSPAVSPYTLGTPLTPASTVKLPYPIVLSARSKNTYFVEREAFNLIGMFQSPMMLIMLFTGAMLFAMPYLMANMDPETRNEVTERQQRMVSAQTSLQNMDLGGLKKMLGGESDNSKSPSRPLPPTASSSGKAKSKARKR